MVRSHGLRSLTFTTISLVGGVLATIWFFFLEHLLHVCHDVLTDTGLTFLRE